jgi:hypothetical protein
MCRERKNVKFYVSSVIAEPRAALSRIQIHIETNADPKHCFPVRVFQIRDVYPGSNNSTKRGERKKMFVLSFFVD